MATSDPGLRAPVLEVMWPDIENVIASIAGRYTDLSCPQLHFEDLVAEGRLKLAELNHKGLIDRLPRNDSPTRAEWFKFFKTVVNNHIKGLVHRHRGTLKRTGHRIPTKDQRNDPMRESNKPVEISFDDPEAHLQIGEPVDCEASIDERDLAAHVRSKLTPVEKLVFDQLVSPNDEAWFWSVMHSFRGSSDRIKVRITEADQAAGLGMTLEQFLSIQESIQQKFMDSRDEQADVQYNMALGTLCSVFHVQVPDSIKPEKDTVARMLTMLSRRESEKVTDDVASLLRTVGARPPEKSSTSMEACFGVMFEAGNRACNSCGVAEACRSEAKTHGIDGTIAYSPKLMGAKSVRSPVLVGHPVDAGHHTAEVVPQPAVSVVEDEASRDDRVRDDEIRTFLFDTFTQRPSKNDLYLDYRGSGEKARYIFWICPGSPGGARLSLRFCNPTDDLKKKLVKVKNGFYLPDSLQAQDAIALINQHAKDRLLS